MPLLTLKPWKPLALDITSRRPRCMASSKAACWPGWMRMSASSRIIKKLLWINESVLGDRQLYRQTVQRRRELDLAAQSAGRAARRGGEFQHAQLFAVGRRQAGCIGLLNMHVAGSAGQQAAAVGGDAVNAGRHG